MKITVPATLAAHAGKARMAHRVVHACEWCSHCSYLTMVSYGSHDYRIAAAAMLITTVTGAILHWIVAATAASPP